MSVVVGTDLLVILAVVYRYVTLITGAVMGEGALSCR